MNYMNSIMIINQLQKNVKLVIISCTNYYGSIANKYDIKIDDVNKLIPNLGSKNKYVLYYRNLQLYLSLGMKLTKVKQFKQSDWLRKYTDFNTGKRKNTDSSFEKVFETDG